jgi:hypothetical protein
MQTNNSKLSNHLKRSRSRNNKTVLLIQRSGSKGGVLSSDEDAESLQEVVEDMIMMGSVDKKNRTLADKTQWKSVTRQCPLLMVEKNQIKGGAEVKNLTQQPSGNKFSMTQT